MAARPLIELRQLCCSLHRCVLHKPSVGGDADALGSRALDRRCGPPDTGAGLALTDAIGLPHGLWTSHLGKKYRGCHTRERMTLLPLHPRSRTSSDLRALPLAMRDASPRKRSSCLRQHERSGNLLWARSLNRRRDGPGFRGPGPLRQLGRRPSEDSSGNAPGRFLKAPTNPRAASAAARRYRSRAAPANPSR